MATTVITSFNSISAHAFGSSLFNATASGWGTSSVNGATPTVSKSAGSAAGFYVQYQLNDPGLASDNITDVQIDFDWATVAAGTNQQTLYGNNVQVGGPQVDSGNSSGHISVSIQGGAVFSGSIDRATLLATVLLWEIVISSGSSGSYQLTISNLQVTVTDDASSIALTRVVPSLGRILGGKLVTIYGTGFSGTPAITFGGSAATGVVVVSATRVRCRTPAHAAGLVDVVVDGVTLANGYRYTDSIFGDLTIREQRGIVINKALNDAPDQCRFTNSGVASVGVGAPAQIVDPASGATLFGGTALVTTDAIDGTPTMPGRQGIDAGDLIWRLNARRPFGTWADQSASDIAQDLLDLFAPQFTGIIEASLPVISLTCDRSQTLSEVLSTLCTLAQCSWRPDDDFGIHVFTTTGGTAPDDVTDATPLYDPPPQVVEDITQVRNRVYVHGAGGAVSYEAAVSLPVWAVGTYASPPGVVTPTTGGSIPASDYSYFMSFVTTYGETTPTNLVGYTIVAISGANNAYQLDHLDQSVHADPRVTGRRIWRTKSGVAPSGGFPGDSQDGFLVTTLGNTAAIGEDTFLDTKSDAQLTEHAPSTDTTGTVFEMVEDAAAQTYLAALLNVDGGADDGIREGYISDATLTTSDLAIARGNAELTLFAYPIKTVTYACRDEKSVPGETVSINLTRPPVVGDFKIQSVEIDQIQIDAEGALFPRFKVTASSVRFTLDDLLRGILLSGGGSGGAGAGSSSASSGSGGGGTTAAATMIGPEVPSGAINSSNTVYATAVAFTRLLVFKNGLLMNLTTDYTITGTAQFTMVVAPITGDSLVVYYF